MKNYQCWLDLQHYEQHLKKLSTIKHRNVSKKQQHCHYKIRSKTVQRYRLLSNKQTRNLSSTKETFLKNEWKNKLKNMRQILEQKQMAKQKIQQQNICPDLQQIQKQFIIMPLKKDQEKDEQVSQISHLRGLRKKNRFSVDEDSKFKSKHLETNQLFMRKTMNGFVHNEQNMANLSNKRKKKFQTDNENEDQNKIYQSVSQAKNRIKTEEEQFLFVNRILNKNIEKNNNIKQIFSQKSSAEKINKNRENQLKRFMRFSELNYVKQLHTYILELKITSLSPMHNSHMLSFWIQANTISQKVKSSCYTFQQLTNKQINLSFIHRPSGSIQIIIKFFRKLESFVYGQYLLTVSKQNDSKHNFIIQQQNSMNFMQFLGIGKNINKKNTVKKKMTKNINENRFTNYR